MNDTRYSRWQGLALAQLSVAIALLSALSVAGLGAGLSLVQNQQFICALVWKRTFGASMALLFTAIALICLTVISRTIDFRLTARKVRAAQTPNYTRPLTFLRLNAEAYGNLSWAFFWFSCVSFASGGLSMALTVAHAYAARLQ